MTAWQSSPSPPSAREADSRTLASGDEADDADGAGSDDRMLPILTTGNSRTIELPRHPLDMSITAASPKTLALRELLDARRDEFRALLAKYTAANPRIFGSIARGTTSEGSDIDILVEMDPADGNLLMRASGLMEETRALFGRDDIDIFPEQLLKHPISESVLSDAIAL